MYWKHISLGIKCAFSAKELPLLQHGKPTHPHNSCLERIRSYATAFSQSQS